MKQSEEVVRQEAQQQAEDAFNGFMLWMKRGTLWSCLFLAVVVFGCNAGVEDGSYPAYNGEQYNPSNMNNK
jgi:hypothetical protein|tara:strand:- start:890 stop:1102 length:213 start_codon:yes stop_codon:yes gene_type:complete